MSYSSLSGGALPPSLRVPPTGNLRLGDLPDPALREMLHSLHLKRDQLKSVIAMRHDPSGHVSPESFLVRLNLSTQNVQYVGAQIVQALTEDDVQVRGIEMSQGGAEASRLSGVQGTKLQYVSNQAFTEAEILDLSAKIRGGVFENLPVAVANARIECMGASLRAMGGGAISNAPIAVSQVVPPAVGPIAASSIASVAPPTITPQVSGFTGASAAAPPSLASAAVISHLQALSSSGTTQQPQQAAAASAALLGLGLAGPSSWGGSAGAAAAAAGSNHASNGVAAPVAPLATSAAAAAGAMAAVANALNPPLPKVERPATAPVAVLPQVAPPPQVNLEAPPPNEEGLTVTPAITPAMTPGAPVPPVVAAVSAASAEAAPPAPPNA